ncbi:hypothetical protein COCC4DRAFT_46563 [Bipolaris maydis ATCC 48331]|uniref:Mus7/MMS22 family-domain-containing protein n=2 Tax=Cochliobolus heterostrophus TaxID=5016 RepID=M2V7S7_COCH5|nr:uncharacterized protein COCC4DRAFT_46563 [Bipolaris maydis ATCC 48331]EMD96072.1 hypothetical protein COCHEDRAFT_1221714 [Bipolaris maydis C5]KAJ5030763.1 Mus7/MMS22 family-domain-containing protein [Bipolaris maydis]ENI10932.1 hypothetical protein COCC4DRAFT_46563 [Bipolaris maydis ATCC 48331]KAJ6213153.1 Mus7/MMS22 family-domain-containing protein [Bipolaris maydis]KAJ6286317.1 Mus7/MMS22 family-domain-containing protein [Bipolaris maydis]
MPIIYRQKPIPPASNRVTACRCTQMSKWRQKGFVQDSDEDEEESQLESQASRVNSGLSRRVVRVEDDINEVKQAEETRHPMKKDGEGSEGYITVECNIERTCPQEKSKTSPTKRNSPKRPTPSPFTPSSTHNPRPQPSESPDPLQGSPTPKAPRTIRTHSSQHRPKSPTRLHSSTVSIPLLFDELEPPFQAAQSSSPLQQAAPAEHLKGNTGASNILNEFGIAPLSDNSEDDELSDPPTDLESPPPVFIQPHRRTAVQVVIPSSTALQRHLGEERARRDFRQRKPIQLHPYALEGEMYRREVQSRGLQPVRRERSRSPQGHRKQQNDKSQEQEFNPDENPTSSPPEVEIPVSSPNVPQLEIDGNAKVSGHQHAFKRIRRPPSTQLRHPHAAKRRKPNIPSTQDVVPPTSIFENSRLQRDIWSIPLNSPPYSSSPPPHANASARRPGVLRTTTPAPNLPTPSTSSILQDDSRPLLESDSDTVLHSTQRPSSGLRRPTRVVLTDSSSSGASSASEAEQSDSELRNVSRKIKGVLPASWLRFDRQTQERRKAQQRERDRMRVNIALSPERNTLVRGVAQKITKPMGRPPLPPVSTASSKDPVVISDESEDELRAPFSRPIQDAQDPVTDASALAKIFDSRYADDDNLSDMEHDRLHLPTLGGTGPKRKRQSKLTDVFGKAKKVKSSTNVGRLSSGQSRKRKYGHPKKPRRPAPPAMSVVDVILSPSKRVASVPHFLRVARRQALQRPDLARQSPHNKQIRLYNAQDTEEANTVLEQWQKGVLKPKSDIAMQERRPGSPLTNRADNQQYAERESGIDADSAKDLDRRLETTTEVSHLRQRTNVPTGLRVFRRSSSNEAKSTRRSKKTLPTTKHHKRPGLNGSLPFRVAQLEGDENDFGRDHRKIAFEKGLLHVDQQFRKQLPNEHHIVNPQLARYLADDGVELPLLSSTNDSGEGTAEAPSKPGPMAKKRLKLKSQARRIDVDAREFRQPSEPAIQEVLGTVDFAPVQEPNPDQDFPILHGLGPFGTRYPITFDVYSLVSGTYFHASTLIGSNEFHRALSIGKTESRNLDETAGYSTVTDGTMSVRCGSWNDETSSNLHDLVRNVSVSLAEQPSNPNASTNIDFGEMPAAKVTRSLITYISDHLSFLDPIDRKDFMAKAVRLCQTLFDGALAAFNTVGSSGTEPDWSTMRTVTYLLVISLQLHRIAQHSAVDEGSRVEILTLLKNASKTVVTHLVQRAIPELGNFLELNKRHSVREKGVQDCEVVVESTVVCMHVLEELQMTTWGFWDIVSQVLSPKVSGATHLSAFEAAWATLFTLLPFGEIDVLGIPLRSRRETFQSDNWSCIRDILRRIFELYPSTYRKHSTSLNDYVRANLARCHRLMTHWHWRRPELMLNAVVDFFGKNGLRGLRREASVGSFPFPDKIAADPSLTVEPNEYSFHISLKCLTLGLRGMKDVYPEKKIRSFVFRCLPNHGRAYPKDQPLDEESLAALRNHHDLLSVLYWDAPPACRPKLDQIRGLVNHDNSHREACRLSVRAWANLTAFQLSTEEPYKSAEPFALWHKEIMHQTLRQYKLAKIEADDFLKSIAVEGSTNISAVMVRQTMERNQEQVIATLRDCIAGMSKAIKCARDLSSLRNFLIESDIMHLLELPHLEDRRLVNVIHDTLKVLQEYANLQKIQKIGSKEDASQQTNEESQDYGDFPDMDDLDDLDDLDSAPPAKQVQQSSLDFIQTSLWHLLSNAFGAEDSPDDVLLKDCVDTWICIAEGQIVSGERSWSYYLDSFSQVSWKQLRQTEQTRKFGPYFMAAIMDCDPALYEEHRNDFLQALMVCLVEREAMLRFQDRLLHAIIKRDGNHPLMQNLPFFRDLETGAWDINPESLRTRRLALISSILSNMRDDIYAVERHEPGRASEARRLYACMLKDFMASMKYNYQQLSQGTTITGAYVEFVQKIVQFLKQYTSDIVPVLPFFTDSAAFPLPAEDPTYVVARLCGYAPKLSDSGKAKELSVFVQTVAQQAAADNQQTYLVHQLTTALCTDQAPAVDRATLRSVLLQAIFPAYLEEMLSSSTAFAICLPILQVLPPTLDTMIFDLRITQPESLASIATSIVSISHAFIRTTEQLKDNHHFLQRPYVLSALAHMLGAMTSILPPLEYLSSRTSDTVSAPPFITYINDLTTYILALLHTTELDTVPSYTGDAHAPLPGDQHTALLAFCRRSLAESIKTNWSESAGAIWFGVGNARREVLLDVGSVEEERVRLEACVVRFRGVFDELYGVGDYRDGYEMSAGLDVFV